MEEVAANGMCGTSWGVTCAMGKPAFAQGFGASWRRGPRGRGGAGDMGATALVVTAAAGRGRDRRGGHDAARATGLDAERSSAANVRSLEMLTGDHAQAASAIAAQAGVTAVSAELLPEDKVARIRELQGSGEVVAMVGDGINDAPALATADLGITMGAAASDTALEVADVALLSDDLAQLPRFFALSVRTMHIVRENIAFAIWSRRSSSCWSSLVSPAWAPRSSPTRAWPSSSSSTACA